jgi:hypothetical protein
MIGKAFTPHVMRGGYSFFEKIMFNQELARDRSSLISLWRT